VGKGNRCAVGKNKRGAGAKGYHETTSGRVADGPWICTFRAALPRTCQSNQRPLIPGYCRCATGSRLAFGL